ncbi:hypothetical protein CEXT_429541 [Caerostris extrusa]|uniref:Uncharacterized protein n=1 Tax=Caerostris extrusa TaxID=172846 RepID=A0AAV4MU93_CAEEX|nr:hypothetical protein CEXT_429541 [Caerostris extrusa]
MRYPRRLHRCHYQKPWSKQPNFLPQSRCIWYKGPFFLHRCSIESWWTLASRFNAVIRQELRHSTRCARNTKLWERFHVIVILESLASIGRRHHSAPTPTPPSAQGDVHWSWESRR